MLKKKWKKALATAALVLSLGLVAGCTADNAQKDAKTYKVGIVQLVEHRAVNIANKGFVDGLASRGYKDNVTFDQQNAQA
ncbi:MAG: ABC transporter substrate-binding protein, partial [Selenomonadales bacterium]|nr:ABC transporter substrate-binding protein [Selenomonadales bacterium]